MQYADDLVLLAKEETVLQGIIYRLIKTGRCYGLKMNLKKSKVMGISRQPSPLQIMIVKKLENVECLNYLGMVITRDAKDGSLWRTVLGRGRGPVVRETTD